VDLAGVTMPSGQVDTDLSAYAVDSDQVVLAPQAISFTPPATGIAGQSATLSATGGGSGNPVVFSVDPSSGTGVCHVTGTSGTTLDYDAPGACVIDADQAGNASYAAAPTVTATIVVNQGPAFTQDTPPTSMTAGQAYAYTFAASGDPAPSFALAAGAPTWLSLDPASGALSGTPPAGTTSFTYAVVAANSAGTVTAGPFTVTVQQDTNPRDADISTALACPGSAPVGAVASCTVTILNAGPSTAHFVAAEVALPFPFWRVSSGGGWWFGHFGLWFVGRLGPGSSTSFTVSFRAVWPTSGTVWAAAWSANPDPSWSDNVATASVSFGG